MSSKTLEAIGERHNLRAGEISPLKDVGIFNAIYLVGGEYVLDSRGPNARRRCCSRSCASSSVRLAGRGRIYTEAHEPSPQRGLAGYEVSL
jgi:hypothetical protein